MFWRCFPPTEHATVSERRWTKGAASWKTLSTGSAACSCGSTRNAWPDTRLPLKRGPGSGRKCSASWKAFPYWMPTAWWSLAPKGSFPSSSLEESHDRNPGRVPERGRPRPAKPVVGRAHRLLEPLARAGPSHERSRRGFLLPWRLRSRSRGGGEAGGFQETVGGHRSGPGSALTPESAAISELTRGPGPWPRGVGKLPHEARVWTHGVGGWPHGLRGLTRGVGMVARGAACRPRGPHWLTRGAGLWLHGLTWWPRGAGLLTRGARRPARRAIVLTRGAGSASRGARSMLRGANRSRLGANCLRERAAATRSGSDEARPLVKTTRGKANTPRRLRYLVRRGAGGSRHGGGGRRLGSGLTEPRAENHAGSLESQPARRLQQIGQALRPAHQALDRMCRRDQRLVEQGEVAGHFAYTQLDRIARGFGFLLQAERRVPPGTGQHGGKEQRHRPIAKDPIGRKLPRVPFAQAEQTPPGAGNRLDHPRAGHVRFVRRQRLVSCIDALQELGGECVAGRRTDRLIEVSHEALSLCGIRPGRELATHGRAALLFRSLTGLEGSAAPRLFSRTSLPPKHYGIAAKNNVCTQSRQPQGASQAAKSFTRGSYLHPPGLTAAGPRSGTPIVETPVGRLPRRHKPFPTPQGTPGTPETNVPQGASTVGETSPRAQRPPPWERRRPAGPS